MKVTLLGPQRKTATVRTAVAELMPQGPIATVNAGWEEREADTGELDAALGGRMRNLELYRRWQEMLEQDPDYAAIERVLTERLAEMQSLYSLRLGHAMDSVAALARRGEVPAVQYEAMLDAIRAVQALDNWHLTQVAEARATFYAKVRLGERELVQRHRAEVARAVSDVAGFVFTGGHVGVLLHVLHVFDLGRLLKPPVIAWSAGAMALSERVVLFHDHAPSDNERGRYSEVYAEGLGAYSGVLPFPHARSRLRLEDRDLMRLMGHRFAPRKCVLFADGVRVDLEPWQPLPQGARYLSPDQGVVQVGSGEAQ